MTSVYSDIVCKYPTLSLVSDHIAFLESEVSRNYSIASDRFSTLRVDAKYVDGLRSYVREVPKVQLFVSIPVGFEFLKLLHADLSKKIQGDFLIDYKVQPGDGISYSISYGGKIIENSIEKIIEQEYVNLLGREIE